ncbi:MAG: hypothetical protein FJ306_08325 [Planctomycetes bacterium]|nr:hypothetical protein [Planctomycetota bacterium]
MQTAMAPVTTPCAAPQDPPASSVQWTRVGGGGECVVLGPSTLRLAAPSALATTATGGVFTVHFAADAAGRPEPLVLDVPVGAEVQLATAAAAPATLAALQAKDAGGWGGEDGEFWRWTGAVAADQRLVLALGKVRTASVHARMRGDAERYELVYDAKARTVRLVRVLGGPPLTLATATLPDGLDAPRTLEFELHGFRLQVFVDGVRVLQVLDGAIGSGEVGMAWSRDGLFGGGLGADGLAVAPPAAPRPSAALVRDSANTATLHAASAAPPGPWAIVELALDRPHPLLLREASGCEPWLLQRPAAPVVLCATPKQELGPGTFAETPAQGPARAALRWPTMPTLVGQVALARVVFVAADGSAELARSPAVALRL